ncbi:hypothetical protein ACQ4PT_005858 [Festuca glaucescens]
MPPTHPPLCALALAAASIRELADSPGPGGGEGSRTRSRRGGPVITEPPTPNPSPVITDTRSRSRMAARTPSSSHTPVDGSAASRDTNEPPSGESNDSSDDVSDDGESTPTASGNEQENGLDSEATQDQMPKQKKARKARRPNQLTDETFVITRVDGRGVPASPVKFSKGYSNAIGCIVRETVKITCTNLRSKEHENLRQRLLNKLFNRYIVPGDDKERVKTKALSMMTKALNSWRTRANAMKEEDFESVIKKKWPQIDEEDWKQFILSRTNDEFKQKSEWGKHMRSQNKFFHKLGSRGYLGKKPKWDKEDAALIAAGKEPPFSCIEPGRARDFLRARASFDPVTGEPVFKHQKLAEVFDKLKKQSHEPQSQSSQDSIEGERWEDPLSKALGGKEVGGRVRGVGNGAPWKIYFPEAPEVARQRRRARYERDSHFEERVAAVAEATLRRILAERGQEQGRPPLHPDTLILAEKDQEPGHPPLHPDTCILAERDQEQGCPPLHPDTHILAERDQGQGHPPLHPDTQMLPFHIVGPSSSASVSGIAPGQPNPIDDITVITPCQLMAPMLGSMLTVAHGQVYPKTMHCVDLAPDMARVDVTKVLDPFVDLKISDHPEPECNTLGQYKGHAIKWPKVAIKLCGTSTGSSPSLTTPCTPPLGTSPLGPCAPSFVDLDGDHGAEDDMPIDQEQAIGDALNPQHEPAAKTILSPNVPKSAALGGMVQRGPHLRNRNMQGEGKRRDEPAPVRRSQRRRG